jgi:hypothetical protein
MASLRVDFERMLRESSDRECSCCAVKNGDEDSVLKNVKRDIVETTSSNAITASKVRTMPFIPTVLPPW